MQKAVMTIVCALVATGVANAAPPPIIDMHLHAQPVASYGPPGQNFCTPMEEIAPFDPGQGVAWPDEWMRRSFEPVCENFVPPAASDEALMNDTLEIMERRNIYGVVSSDVETLRKWKQVAPERVIPALGFSLDRDELTADEVGALHEAGEIDILGEVTNQYRGYAPDAPEFDAYWAMAEANDLPVGIHIGGMPPGSAYYINQNARISLGDPFGLEEVLVKHPKLRVYVMHAGYPHIGRTIAMMRQYPQLYVEIGVLPVTTPRAEFHAFLERLVQAGMGKRILFGSDQMIWPGIIEASIEAVETAELTKSQKRDIFYNNAARFLRLSEDEIARHHDK